MSDPAQTLKPRVRVLGVPFDPVTYDSALTAVESAMTGQGFSQIVTPNPEMILESRRNPELKAALENAALSVPDGVGVLWAAHYLSLPRSVNFFRRWGALAGSLLAILFAPQKLKNPLPERVTGADLMDKIIGRSTDKGWRVFMLGAGPGVAEKAVLALSQKYPRAAFVGYHEGSPEDKDLAPILRRLEETRPDLLFVAFGSPKQELWIARHRDAFKTVKLAMGVGGAFDFAAGVLPRAPLWMRRCGLEWLWRLLRQPRRLGRIWNATARFIAAVVRAGLA